MTLAIADDDPSEKSDADKERDALERVGVRAGDVGIGDDDARRRRSPGARSCRSVSPIPDRSSRMSRSREPIPSNKSRVIRKMNRTTTKKIARKIRFGICADHALRHRLQRPDDQRDQAGRRAAGPRELPQRVTQERQSDCQEHETGDAAQKSPEHVADAFLPGRARSS